MSCRRRLRDNALMSAVYLIKGAQESNIELEPQHQVWDGQMAPIEESDMHAGHGAEGYRLGSIK